MIEIDFDSLTYVCPYCGCKQSFNNKYDSSSTGFRYNYSNHKLRETDIQIFHIECSNKKCSMITVAAQDLFTKKQFDLYPQKVFKDFPSYVPQQIRDDYIEANLIMRDSPKASSTLLRRCLQGMIRDFWNIKKNKLKDEIDELQTLIPPSQWKAIDGLRKIGNIGAHMEKDINLIIDVDEGEAERLARLIELLIEKWYVSRHDEEELYNEITKSADSKKSI